MNKTQQKKFMCTKIFGLPEKCHFLPEYLVYSKKQNTLNYYKKN